MRFASGCARLVTMPVAMASPLIAMTIEIVVVACLAVRVPGVPWVTMRSTSRRISSATRSESRSYLPSAHRNSMTRFLPST